MFRFIRSWLDRRVIAQASITPAEWDTAFASLPLLDGLSGQEKSTLQELVILFLQKSKGTHAFASGRSKGSEDWAHEFPPHAIPIDEIEQ